MNNILIAILIIVIINLKGKNKKLEIKVLESSKVKNSLNFKKIDTRTFQEKIEGKIKSAKFYEKNNFGIVNQKKLFLKN